MLAISCHHFRIETPALARLSSHFRLKRPANAGVLPIFAYGKRFGFLTNRRIG
jgi:hypothetical protein